MTLRPHYVIAPKPTQVAVASQSVANILSIMTSLPREGGDERHIGVNEWVDRVRLSRSDEQIHQVTQVMWGVGIEGILNAVPDRQARDDFELFLEHLEQVPANKLRDTCLHWLLHSVHRKVFLDGDAFTPTTLQKLLNSREQFISYLTENASKKLIQDNFESIADLYFDPPYLKELTLSVLSDLWHTHFKAELARHQAEIDRVVEAFAQVDLSGMTTFEAMQVITGRDLRPVFRADALAQFEQILFVPSKHNGPYIMWFGDKTTLYIIFTARMPASSIIAGGQEPDLNVLIQRFKALSDDNRMQVLLAIREQEELSTQDIIEQFDLNKSAASRYLGQLLANGFITERRDSDGKTKYYSLNTDVVDAFLQSIARVLKS